VNVRLSLDGGHGRSRSSSNHKDIPSRNSLPASPLRSPLLRGSSSPGLSGRKNLPSIHSMMTRQDSLSDMYLRHHRFAHGSIYDLEEQRHSEAKAEEKVAFFIDEENRRLESIRKEKESRRRKRRKAIQRKRASVKIQKIFRGFSVRKRFNRLKLERASLVVHTWIQTVVAKNNRSAIASVQALIRAYLQVQITKTVLTEEKAKAAEEELEKQEQERNDEERKKRERREQDQLRRELEEIEIELRELERKRREEDCQAELDAKAKEMQKQQQKALRVQAAVKIQRKYREHRRRVKSAILRATMEEAGFSLMGSKRASSTVMRRGSDPLLTFSALTFSGQPASSTSAGTAVTEELCDIDEQQRLKEVSFRFQCDPHDDEDDDERRLKEIGPPPLENEKDAACCGPGGSGCTIS